MMIEEEDFFQEVEQSVQKQKKTGLTCKHKHKLVSYGHGFKARMDAEGVVSVPSKGYVQCA